MQRLLRFGLVAFLMLSVLTWVGAPATVQAQGTVYTDTMDASSTPLLTTTSPDPAQYLYAYQNDQFIIQTLQPGFSGDLLAYTNLSDMSDVSVAVDFAIAGDLTGKYGFVGCRSADIDSGYQAEVHPGTGLVNIWRFEPNDVTQLATVTDTTNVNIGNVNNRVEIECRGTTITAIVNGQRLLTVQDASYTTGSTFIGAGKSSQTTDLMLVGFDNLTVTDFSGGAVVQPTQPAALPTAMPAQPTQPAALPTAAPAQPTTPATGAVNGEFPLMPLADPTVDPASTLDQAFFVTLVDTPIFESNGASGNLSSGSPQYLTAGVNAPDFYAELTYLTPPTDPPGLWTFGFCFWADADNNCYDFFVSYNGTRTIWGLGVFSPDGYSIVQSGDLPAGAIDVTPGAENEVTVVVYRGIAMLSTNTYELDASLPVPGAPFGGDVKAAAAYVAANQAETRTLPVTLASVGVWDLSAGVYPDIFAADATETPGAPALPTAAPVQPTAAVAPTVAAPPVLSPTVAASTGSTGNAMLTQIFANERALAVAAPPVFSSVSGVLTQQLDTYTITSANVALANVYVTASFTNPTDLSVSSSYVVGIRDNNDNREFRFAFDAFGNWAVAMGTNPAIARGSVTNVDPNPGGINTIEIIARGPVGIFAINGQAVQQIDLSGNLDAGDVYIASGVTPNTTMDQRPVPYSNYLVYQVSA